MNHFCLPVFHFPLCEHRESDMICGLRFRVIGYQALAKCKLLPPSLMGPFMLTLCRLNLDIFLIMSLQKHMLIVENAKNCKEENKNHL